MSEQGGGREFSRIERTAKLTGHWGGKQAKRVDNAAKHPRAAITYHIGRRWLPLLEESNNMIIISMT